MSITNISTRRIGRGPDAVRLVVGGRDLKIAHSDKGRFPTAEDFETELERRHGGPLPVSLFVHYNRDGSVAVATGAAPDVWPEDELEV